MRHSPQSIFQASPVKRYSPTYSTGSINDSGGAYKGFLNTQLLLPSSGNGTIDTDTLALYADASGNIGILRGNIPGSLYSARYGLKAEGVLNRIEMATGTGIAPGTLSGITPSTYILTPQSYNWLSGPSLTLTAMNSDDLSFSGYNFGVQKAVMSGTYDTAYSPLGDVVFSYDQAGSAGSESVALNYTQIAASYDAATGGYFRGSVAGGSVAGGSVDWTSAKTYVFGGTVKGIFDPSSSGTWNATCLTTGFETAKFMAMAANADGQAKLAALNIPFVNVGSVDLIGSRFTQTGDSLSVSMTGVNFYAYSNGQVGKYLPQIMLREAMM